MAKAKRKKTNNDIEQNTEVTTEAKKPRKKRAGKKNSDAYSYKGEFVETCLAVYDSLNIENGQTEFTSVDCLKWLNAHLTPHCDEKGRYETTKEQLRENSLVGIMLSNCSALEIIDNKYRIITSEPQGHNIKKAFGIKAYWDKDEYKEEKLPISSKFESLNKLLNKEKVIDYEDER